MSTTVVLLSLPTRVWIPLNVAAQMVIQLNEDGFCSSITPSSCQCSNKDFTSCAVSISSPLQVEPYVLAPKAFPLLIVEALEDKRKHTLHIAQKGKPIKTLPRGPAIEGLKERTLWWMLNALIQLAWFWTLFVLAFALTSPPTETRTLQVEVCSALGVLGVWTWLPVKKAECELSAKNNTIALIDPTSQCRCLREGALATHKALVLGTEANDDWHPSAHQALHGVGGVCASTARETDSKPVTGREFKCLKFNLPSRAQAERSSGEEPFFVGISMLFFPTQARAERSSGEGERDYEQVECLVVFSPVSKPT
ncbi:hypothetical protein DFH06DRAFT_1148460 [Mycena polygramma]|nr:hypothetical protein DFH06DRAFT_1148460 [Mycena polygramma]